MLKINIGDIRRKTENETDDHVDDLFKFTMGLFKELYDKIDDKEAEKMIDKQVIKYNMNDVKYTSELYEELTKVVSESEPEECVIPQDNEVCFIPIKIGNKEISIFRKPDVFDKHYPIEIYYNKEQKSTTILFKDGSKTTVTAHDENHMEAHAGILVALAKRILSYNNKSKNKKVIDDLCDRFEYYEDSLAAIFGVVTSYFISNGIVKDQKVFDLWLVELVSSIIKTKN